jgi:hypothetical protein
VPVRREEPHPGASYKLFDPHGLCQQALSTISKHPDSAYLGARQCLLLRVEDGIKGAKKCGSCWCEWPTTCWPAPGGCVSPVSS